MPTIDLLSGALAPRAPEASSAATRSRELAAPALLSEGAPPSAGATTEGNFAAELVDALKEVNDIQLDADNKATAFVRGDDIAVHQVMAAMTRAELSVQLTTAVATKAIQAYQEIWRIDV